MVQGIPEQTAKELNLQTLQIRSLWRVCNRWWGWCRGWRSFDLFKDADISDLCLSADLRGRTSPEGVRQSSADSELNGNYTTRCKTGGGGCGGGGPTNVSKSGEQKTKQVGNKNQLRYQTWNLITAIFRGVFIKEERNRVGSMSQFWSWLVVFTED